MNKRRPLVSHRLSGRWIGALAATLVLGGLSLTLLPSQTAQAQTAGGFKVIVHPDNPTSSLTKREVSNFFLKKSRNWDHGVRAEPVDQPLSAGARDPFSKMVHGRSATAIKNHWAQSIFSGKESGPPELASDAEVVAFVLANPGGIGYVSSTAQTGRTKVIQISDL